MMAFAVDVAGDAQGTAVPFGVAAAVVAGAAAGAGRRSAAEVLCLSASLSMVSPCLPTRLT